MKMTPASVFKFFSAELLTMITTLLSHYFFENLIDFMPLATEKQFMYGQEMLQRVMASDT